MVLYARMALLVLFLNVSTAQAGLISRFDTNAEGWTIVTFVNLSTDNYTMGNLLPAHVQTGGNPGGYIFFEEKTTDGRDFTFAAPGTWLGDQRTAFGSTLTYDLLHTPANNYYHTTDVMLVNGNTRLLWRSDSNLEPSGTWSSVIVHLVPSANWRLNTTGGPLATIGDFNNVLGNLTGLFIRGEYRNGIETTGLDNVQFGVPEPGSLALLACALPAGAAWLWRRRKAGRHFSRSTEVKLTREKS